MDAHPYLAALRGVDLDSVVDATMLGILSSRDLAERGITRRAAAAAMRRGDLERLRVGWFATRDACHEAASALRIGGALTCTSLMRLAGIWTIPRPELHIRIPKWSAIPQGGGFVAHRAGRGGSPLLVPADAPFDALRAAGHCLPLEELVAALDGGLNAGRWTLDELRAAFLDAGGALASAVELADGRVQSGSESVFRVGTRSLQLCLVPQFFVPTVGFDDFLIGERRLVECDSRTYHDGDRYSTNDRKRDIALKRLGFLVLRLTYAQVIAGWADVERTLLALIRANQHRWTRPTRQLLIDGLGWDRAQAILVGAYTTQVNPGIESL